MRHVVSISASLGLALGLAFVLPSTANAATIVSVKAVGLTEKGASDRAARRLNRQINRWAQKNKLTSVRVGVPMTVCNRGPAGLFTCTRSARVG